MNLFHSTPLLLNHVNVLLQTNANCISTLANLPYLILVLLEYFLLFNRQ